MHSHARAKQRSNIEEQQTAPVQARFYSAPAAITSSLS
jgi:hypothetical protein